MASVSWPSSSSTSPSTGSNGVTAPTSSTEVGGINPTGNLQPLQTDASGNLLVSLAAEPGAPLHVIVDSSALPSGAATQTTLATVSTTLGSILLDMTNGSQIIQLPTGASTSANQTTEITALQAIQANQTNGTQETTITGTVPLPTGAATSALQSSTQGSVAAGTAATASTLIGGTFNTTAPALTNGQQASAQLSASGQLQVTEPDLVTTGQAAQTATVNNILTTASGTAATSTTGYRSGSVQITSTGTGGAYIFEGSNDNVTFVTIPVFNQLILTGTPIVAAITPTAGTIIYVFPVAVEFVRVRISTTITGGSIQAISRFSPEAIPPAIVQVAQNTAANLLTTATVASGTITTVGSVTSSQSAIPGVISDIASAAIVTTTTTAAITPTFGSSYLVNMDVTAGAGTGTFVVNVQESADSGTNWYTVYTFPAVTVASSAVTAGATQNSPVITLSGNRVRYVQTLTGVTSITRSVFRLQSSQAGYQVPTGTIFTDRSGTTSATPSTSTQVAPQNQSRRYLLIQNLSGTTPIYINFTSAANAGSGSIYLTPLGSYSSENATISTEAVNILATVASVPFSCKEG